jgi:putative endonuclease
VEKRLLGRWGEQTAANYLKSKGFKIIGMNYSCRMGEIDLIAENRKYIVFVEVKLRKSKSFALAREYVNRSKQEKIKITASLWLSQNETKLQPRFDVIEIYAPEGVNSPLVDINHIENAFE